MLLGRESKLLKSSREKIQTKISYYTEEYVESDHAAEFRVEAASIAVNINCMVEEFRVKLGETRLTQWEELVTYQSWKVKAYAKKIKDWVKQFAPSKSISIF